MIKVILVMLGASVFFVLGVARLLITDSISLLGVPVSCGNPLGYLTGTDNASGVGLSLCRGPLRNGAIEGITLILIAVLFCIFAFVLFMSSALKRRPSADPDEFSW